MKKAVIVFGSTTGSTKEMAEIIEAELKVSGLFDVELKNAADISADILPLYDIIIFGCSTWGDGVLQDDFAEFAEKLKAVSLTGKKAAVFGPGESTYPQFCKAVDILEAMLVNCGAQLLFKGLKVDVLEADSTAKVQGWSKKLLII